MENLTTKNCKNCGRIIRGRSDKKFCDDSCRSYYNNQQRNGESPYVKRINSILKKNREVLTDLLSETPIRIIKKSNLLSRAFLFGYATYIEEKQQNVFFLYEFKYKELEDGMVEIQCNEAD